MMGFGDYSQAAHQALIAQRRSASPFVARGPDPLMVPRQVEREARDSEEHPASLGIVFVLDVTGSMGRVPRELAERTLPSFMAALLNARVEHPAVCFMAVGHADDVAPLQVGQFESTASLIDSWLTRLWLEGGGRGQHECYELAMYFAARHMQLDSVTQRGERGVLFLTADTLPNPAVSRVQVQRILGDTLEQDLPIRDLVDELQRTFEPFVLLAAEASPRVERAWRDLFGDRVVRLGDPADTATLCSGLVALLRGSVPSLEAYLGALRDQGVPRVVQVRVASGLLAFASSIGRTDAPRSVHRPLTLPTGKAPSGLDRL